MAKRFIDTGFLDQKWIRKLSPEKKIFIIYLMLKCDNAGIIDLDMEDAEFWIGKKIGDPQIFLSSGFLIPVIDDKFFIPKFLKWQYPNFPHSKVHQQKQAINILIGLDMFDTETNNLSKTYLNFTQTLPDSQVTVSVNDNVIVNENEKGRKCLMRNSGVILSTIEEAFSKSDDLLFADPKYYYNSALAWSDSGGNLRIDWIATVSNFARRDMRDQKLKIKKKSRQETEKSNFDFTPLPEGDPMPDSLKKRISKIGKS